MMPMTFTAVDKNVRSSVSRVHCSRTLNHVMTVTERCTITKLAVFSQWVISMWRRIPKMQYTYMAWNKRLPNTGEFISENTVIETEMREQCPLIRKPRGDMLEIFFSWGNKITSWGNDMVSCSLKMLSCSLKKLILFPQETETYIVPSRNYLEGTT